MSFIEEQRKNTIEENNTAQSEFLDILDNLNPQLYDISVREPLYGDLDFSVLKDCNFTNITSLQFAKGYITSLNNIPEGITKIVCEDNLLVEIHVPSSINELNVSGNGIKHLEFKELGNLKELNISKNQFSTLSELPKYLEILKCENNNLKVINLEGIENLKVLHCSNNPTLTIENFPDTITDLQMENNPLIQIKKLSHEYLDEETDSDSGVKHADFMESLNTYFKMKTEYHKQIYDIKKQVYKKAKSKKIARKMMAELKPKCINCDRPVGSLFSNKERTYVARCGDANAPCNLDIRIFAGEYEYIDSSLKQFQDGIQMYKEEIIKQKLDTLFNYIDERESISLFKKKLEDYTETNVIFKELNNQYIDIFFNEEKKEKMQKKIEHISKIQERFNDLILKYKRSDNREILKDAMNIYVNEIKPEMDNLQMIKYETMEINEHDNDSQLFQKEYRLDKLTFTIGSHPKVIKFRSNK
jgi:Leucine-rich repeat (LRR) protein